MQNAETMLLVNDRQTKTFKFHRVLNNGVCPDNGVNFAARYVFLNFTFLGGSQTSRQKLGAIGRIGENPFRIAGVPV